jgi:hypothetical protein
MKVIVGAALVAWVFVSPAGADCYGISGPTFRDRFREAGKAGQGIAPRDVDGDHARDCQTVKALINCGIQQGDAVAMVTNRQAMDGYIAQIIAKCAVNRAHTATTSAPTPGQPAPWLADMNKTHSSRTGIEDGVLYCRNILAGIDKPMAPTHPRDCLAWYGESIRRK